MIDRPDPNLYPDSTEVDAQIIAGLSSDIERLRAQLASARKALEPFGKFAAWVALEHPGWNHDEFSFASEEMPKFKAWRDAYNVLLSLSDENRT